MHTAAPMVFENYTIRRRALVRTLPTTMTLTDARADSVTIRSRREI